MDILDLLGKIEDVIEDANKLPLSSKVVIEKEEILDIINDIRLKLPEEISRAAWVANERQRILSEAKIESEELIEKVRNQQKNLIEEHEITRLAKQQAEEILREAETRSQEIKSGTVKYSDDILQKLQDNILHINNIIEDNRSALKNM